MRRKSMMVVLLLAFCFGVVTPVHWRAQGSNSSQPPARLATRTAVQAAGRGFPWINLRDGHDLLTSYTSAAANELAAAQPLALAAGDFDEDGVPDLLSGYDRSGGGLLVLQRGNVDAIYPDTPAAEQRRARGEFTDAPFLSPARVFALPAAADFVGAGDFNADGHVDVVAATRGSATLYWLAGDGRGGLGQAQTIELPGSLTALTTGEVNRADGLADVIVGVNTNEGAQALVFEGPEGAFSRAPEVIALPAEATALALGQLDEQYEMDLAVAAGSELLIVHGRDRCLSVGEERQAEVKASVIETHAQPFEIAALAVGDFSGDARNEIALLAADGVVQVLGQDARSKTLSKLLGKVATSSRAEAVVANDKAAPLSTLKLVRARVSVSGYDDLVVIDRHEQQLQILTGSMLRGEEAQAAAEPRAPVALAVAGEPVAVLPMRLNLDALSDLVVLKRDGESSVAAAMTAPTATFTVNNTGTQGDFNTSDGKCETATGNGICTLPAAIQQANASAGADLINFSVTSLSFPSGLLGLNDVVTIDGGASRVEISSAGLTFLGGNSTIRGLVLNRFIPGNPQAIHLSSKGGNIVEGCYIGTDTAGANAAFGTNTNCNGIEVSASPNNIIGGTTAAARNVISPPSAGIHLGSNSPGNKVKGNYLGTDAAGTKALTSSTNSTGFIASSANQSPNLQIGGTEAGARNVSSGHVGSNIAIVGETGVLIQGNLIGTDATGAAALSGSATLVNDVDYTGVTGATGFTLGGTTPAARNIISGSSGTSFGVTITTTSAALVQGNYIGTDITGTKALGVRNSGVILNSNVSRSTIGGTVTGARNLISANGIGVTILGAENLVQGNYIGTDVNGTANLGNLNQGVLSGNGSNHRIGGTESGAANIIAFNGLQGVRVTGTGCAVRRNSIFSNAAGVFSILSDGKTPVLTTTAGTTQGTLSGATPNTAHIIEFFSNPACGADTQGKTFIGDTTVTTNASGAASFNVPAGQNVTATATATGGNTSPFSNCAAGGAGCTAFNLQANAADPDQSQDTLKLVDPQPGNATTILGATLKQGGLKVTARYLLQSRANATLAVRLFDQAGNRRGDAGEINITRPTSCPNPLPTREFVIPPGSIDLTPNISSGEVTGLTLSALLIDTSTGTILTRDDLTYLPLPDVIGFEGTPKINGLDAPGGSSLPAGGTLNFTSALRYRLANDVRGKIRLQAFNANGGGQIASKDLNPAVTAAREPTTWNTPLDFQFTVPATVSEISLVASLLAENGAVLKESTPLFYGNKLQIEFGDQSKGHSFTTTGQGSFLSAGSKPNDPALKFKTDLPTSLRGSRFFVLLAQRFNNRDLIRGPYTVDYEPGDDFPRPSFLLDIKGDIPDDADQWEFQILIRPPNDAPAIESGKITIPVQRIRIASVSPLIDKKLLAGTPQEFSFFIAYNTVGPAIITAEATYVFERSGQQTEEIKDFPNGSKPAGASNSTGERFKFTLNLPPTSDIPRPLKLLRVVFKLTAVTTAIVTISSKPKDYWNIEPPPVTLNAGVKEAAKFIGADLTTVENAIGRTLKAARKANTARKTALGAVDVLGSNLLRPSLGEETAAVALTEAAAATAVLFKDFIGINATWEFDPPIPADGSFIADLKLYYSADDLPDDPNFNEAALKVIAFDPALGKVESYPATLDLNAKTATVRINGLARFYSLGVFGPFAQRTLNFPVLQSDVFLATRFNLVNAGTADAALTLRAWANAGTALQAPNLLNPLTSTLAAARMLMGSVSDLFRTTAPLDGWVQTRANRNFVAGYELLTSGNRLDGLNAPSGYDIALILPEAVYDTTQSTEVHLANATNFAGLVRLELHDATGRVVGNEEVWLEAKARFAQRLQDTFQNLAQPFTGYLLILSERDLAAAAVQVLEKEITALNAQPLGGGATKLYAPYLSLGGPTAARLNVVNPTAQAANLTLRLLHNKPGAPAIAPVNLTLGAGQQLQRNFSQLFTLNQLSFTYFTLIVESDTAGLAGNVTLLNPSGAIPFRATMPLEGAPANRLVFAHLNTSDGFYTELGIFNPSAQAARVTLACFKPDGASLGQTSVNVPAGAVFGDYLDSLVSGARLQAAGYFTLSSDQPIVAGAAFGTDSGSALAALPPQILPSTSTNALATVSAASFLGQTLAADSIVAAFGVNLANSVVTANQVPLPTTLADTTVEVRDSLGVERLAPLFFVAPGQINYLIPPGTANGTATVTATNGAGTMALGNVTIAPVAPGLFTANANGQGVAAAVALRIKANGAQSYETIARFDAATQRFVSTPIDLGPTGEQVFLLLFGTGLRGRSSLNATAASIGGVTAQISYAGAQGDLVGLDQVNVAVPRTLLGRGEVDLLLTVDGKAANTVRVNIR